MPTYHSFRQSLLDSIVGLIEDWALSTSDPESGPISEPSEDSYARAAGVAWSSATEANPSTAQTQADIEWPLALENWGTIEGVAGMNAVAGIVLFNTISSVNAVPGTLFSIPAGDADASLSTST